MLLLEAGCCGVISPGSAAFETGCCGAISLRGMTGKAGCCGVILLAGMARYFILVWKMNLNL
jgi:hypothetical protein